MSFDRETNQILSEIIIKSIDKSIRFENCIKKCFAIESKSFRGAKAESCSKRTSNK